MSVASAGDASSSIIVNVSVPVPPGAMGLENSFEMRGAAATVSDPLAAGPTAVMPSDRGYDVIDRVCERSR